MVDFKEVGKKLGKAIFPESNLTAEEVDRLTSWYEKYGKGLKELGFNVNLKDIMRQFGRNHYFYVYNTLTIGGLKNSSIKIWYDDKNNIWMAELTLIKDVWDSLPEKITKNITTETSLLSVSCNLNMPSLVVVLLELHKKDREFAELLKASLEPDQDIDEEDW